MVARNLLFWGVCAAALAAFWGSVRSWSERQPRPMVALDVNSVQATARRVDVAFQKSWDDAGLQHAEPAPKLIVARRIALGLTGTIPSVEEIRRFESWPEDARTVLWLRETLADRRSADFIAERLARAFVGVEDGPFLLYRRRRFVSWLSDELAANRPYDRIVNQLISGNGLWTDSPATNFVTVTIPPGEEDAGPDANKLASRVARAFLGIRLDCAECHDHPFESWEQRDFQSLAAFFGQTQQTLRGIRDTAGQYTVEDRETGETKTIDCDVPYRPDLLPQRGSQRSRLAAWVTHPENRAFSREAVNRAWAMLFGRPLVDPIDNLGIDGDVSPALDILATDFVAHGYDFRRLIEVIASTEVFQQDSRLPAPAADSDVAADGPTEAHETAWAVFPLTRLRPEQVVGALLQSASLSTIDSSSHIVVRLARAIGQNEFVKRYGDTGAEEFSEQSGTIPQRLLLMNGKIVHEKTKDSLLTNAASRIAALAPDDETAVETAMLAVLTRRPDDVERARFVERLADTSGTSRRQRLGDIYWALLNSTEFAWSH